MGLTSAQAKGRIKNIASKNGADPRVLMRIYMMERFLERVSLSVYKDNFIIKGGLLITSMVAYINLYLAIYHLSPIFRSKNYMILASPF